MDRLTTKADYEIVSTLQFRFFNGAEMPTYICVLVLKKAAQETEAKMETPYGLNGRPMGPRDAMQGLFAQ